MSPVNDNRKQIKLKQPVKGSNSGELLKQSGLFSK